VGLVGLGSHNLRWSITAVHTLASPSGTIGAGLAMGGSCPSAREFPHRECMLNDLDGSLVIGYVLKGQQGHAVLEFGERVDLLRHGEDG